MLLPTIVLCAIFCIHNIHPFEDSTGNIHVMKSEIEKAMEDCGETNSSAENIKAEYEKKSSTVPQYDPKHQIFKHNQRNGDEAFNLSRRRRNINILGELANRFLQERLDDNNGDWDYGGGEGAGDSNNDSDNDKGKNQRKNGQSWDDPKDDTSVMDSIYAHNRRNNSNGYSRNNNSQSSRGSSLQDQNSTRNNPNNMGNNFDSRGARFHPTAGFRKLMDDRVYRSVKDLNLTSNYYDPFMTRGIRSVGKDTMRKKRYDRLTKIANENEVDDRGIPKEGLFSKLLQDSVTSQQSRMKIEDQMKACFKELASDAEDNGCSYSNALDRCMGLELRKRKSLINENASSNNTR